MGYVTLEQKIAKLQRVYGYHVPIPLPLEILEIIANGSPLSYFINTAPFSAKETIDKFSLDKVTGFYVEFFKNSKNKPDYDFYILFKDYNKKVSINLETTDLFRLKELDANWHKNFFPNLIPGDLALTILPTTFLKQDLAEFLVGGFESTKWDKILTEGSLVTILETQKLDNSLFVKVICEGKLYWAFGYLVKYEETAFTGMNFHFI